MNAFIQSHVTKRGFSVYERIRNSREEKLAASFPKKKQAITKAKEWIKWLPVMQDETGQTWEHVVRNDRNGKIVKVFN